MAITSAIMQMRRGLEADFDPDKMKPGEWAVSTDKQYVRMCFSVGVCVRMATYDAFEVDMAQIEKILEECQTIEDAVKQIQSEIDAKEIVIEKYVQDAKTYSEMASDEADRATLEADRAKAEADRASSIANIGIATTEKTGLVKPDGTTITVDEDGTIHASEGTTDYEDLENKPQIEGVELSGNKTLSELGIASADDLSTANENIDSNSEKISEVEVKIDTIIEKAELNIKNSASGDNLHLTDSASSKVVEFSLYGKAEQKQYSGKNLVDGIDLQCLASGTEEKTITNAVHLTVGTYTFSWVQSATLTGNVTRNTPTIRILNNESSRKYQDTTPKRNLNAGRYYWTFSIKEENDYVFGYWMHSPGVDVTISNIQLESGSVMTDFEPYVGGIASPNPDNPIEIVVSGSDGSVEVVSCGKNLLKNNAESQTIDGVTFTVNDDGSVTANGTSTNHIWKDYYISASPSVIEGDYILNGCPSGGGSSTYRLNIVDRGTENIKDVAIYSDDGNGVTVPFDATHYYRYQIRIYNNVTLNNIVFKPMIRLASDTDDTYEPYKETVSTISTPNGLSGIKVSSGGNYTDENGQQWICDEIVKYADGSGKRIQRIGKVVFDGSDDESWTYSPTEDMHIILVEDRARKQNTIISHYINEKIFDNFLASTYSVFSAMGSQSLLFRHKGIETISAWKENLKSNHVRVYYELAEPIITGLSAEEIAEIEKLHTFYPITNISNDADCGMSVTYLCDAKNYIDHRLALIESAMLNNI